MQSYKIYISFKYFFLIYDVYLSNQILPLTTRNILKKALHSFFNIEQCRCLSFFALFVAIKCMILKSQKFKKKKQKMREKVIHSKLKIQARDLAHTFFLRIKYWNFILFLKNKISFFHNLTLFYLQFEDAYRGVPFSLCT